MTTAKLLRRKYVKELISVIVEEFGINISGDYLFHKNTREKIFILKNDPALESIDLSTLRVDRLGLYLGEYKNGFFRPSMQGAQFLLEQAKNQKITLKNTFELTKEQVEKVMKGKNIDLKGQPDTPAIILTYQDNAICFGQIKDGILLNYVPKTFRGTTIV